MGIKYISFDVHNTLIKGTILLTRIYEIMQGKLEKASLVLIEDLINRRKQADNDIEKIGRIYTPEDFRGMGEN